MKQNDWIILAIVCGIIAIIYYMQQQKPKRAIKQENFTEQNSDKILTDMYTKGSEWLSGYLSPPAKKENFSQFRF
jgi:hypothetical protein